MKNKLSGESIKNFGKALSKAYGKSITFEPTNPKFKFEYVESNSLTASQWDVFEYLANNGDLKINNHDIEFWKGLRKTLLKGGEFSFCTSEAPAEMILAEISFIAGKKYSITSGDAKAKVSGAIKGNSLTEILENLSKASQTNITEVTNY